MWRYIDCCRRFDCQTTPGVCGDQVGVFVYVGVLVFVEAEAKGCCFLVKSGLARRQPDG